MTSWEPLFRNFRYVTGSLMTRAERDRLREILDEADAKDGTGAVTRAGTSPHDPYPQGRL